MSDIKFNLRKGIKWKGSLLLYFITLFSAFLQLLTHDFWIGKFIKKRELFPKWITEIWFIIALSFTIIVLGNWEKFTYGQQKILIFSSLYILLNSLAATFRDVFLAPNLHNGDIQINDWQRWLWLTLLSLIEVILSFAIIILFFGDQFKQPIQDPITAVYFSIVTFFTIGYGDIYPITHFAKLIVLVEIIYFLLFLSIKIPMIVATIKLKEYNKP